MQKSKSSILAVAAAALGLSPVILPVILPSNVHPGLTVGRKAGKRTHNPAGTKLAKAVAKHRLGLSTIR